MRHAIGWGLLVAAVFYAGIGWAQPNPALDALKAWVGFTIRNSGSLVSVLRCPPDQVPLYGTFPNRSPDRVKIRSALVDSAGDPLGPSEPIDRYAGAGFKLTIDVSGYYLGNASVMCAPVPVIVTPPERFESVLLPRQTTFLPPQFCGNFGETPVGVITNADGETIQEQARVYLFSVQNQLRSFTDLADGTYGPPLGWGLGYFNNTDAPLQLTGQLLCASLPNAQTRVISTNVIDGAPHSLFAAVADGLRWMGHSIAVSGSGENDLLFWGERYVESLTPAEREKIATYLDSAGSLRVSGMFYDGAGLGPPPSDASKQQVVGRAAIATLLIPSGTPVPPPTIVPIVEFYNATLDHYFITANAKEIGDLDSGVHRGWTRTGESFNAYAAGSSGRTGRRPVCRAYGNPAAGLDSHFYSAVPRECIATISNFGDDWLLESTDVFDLELPDTTTGACPADRVAIHRLWNGRADSSHRFVKTLALRAQMIARGFVSEGYGPNGVVFCALP